VEVAARRVDFWRGSPNADVLRRVRDSWPGWSVNWHGDRFEAQLDRAEGRVKIRLPERAGLIRQLRDALLRPDNPAQSSGADTIASLAKRLSEQSEHKEVRVNPAALFDARLSIPLEVRTRLFDVAATAVELR
jgi:hypothetical protein